MSKISKRVSGRTDAALNADVESERISTAGELFGWLDIVRRQDYEHQPTGGTVSKQDCSELIELEVSLLREYAERGYTVPEVIEHESNRLVMGFIPGMTLFEDIFYNSTLQPVELVDKLKEKSRVARAMDSELPEILTEERKMWLLQRESDKLRALGASDEEIMAIPYTAKVKGRFDKSAIPVNQFVFEYLAHLEEVCKPLLDKHSQWFVEANGRNWIGDTRIDMNGVFYGQPDSFLLDTPYLLSDTFWMERVSKSGFFNPRYRFVERAKVDIIREKAIEEGKDSLELFLAFQVSRTFRNLLELAYSYHDVLAIQDDRCVLNGAATFQYLSMMMAHYEMADTGLASAVAHLDDGYLREGLPRYKQLIDQTVQKISIPISVTNPDKLTKWFHEFQMVRHDYDRFMRNSPFSTFSNQNSHGTG